MATIDIFNNRAFSMTSLTDALNRQDFQPSFLRSLNLFTPKRVRTETVAIEQKDGVLSLIPTSPRGAELEQRARQGRDIRDFRTVRIAKSDTITASELANIRQYGSETELAQVQTEVADRLNGPAGIMRDVELTWEHLMLGAIQGIVYDADGSTVIYNYFDQFGVSQPAEINFDFANAADGDIQKKCKQVIRQMQRESKGIWVPGRTMVYALAGDAFYDDLIGSAEVRGTYLNQQAASDLRNDVGNAFESFRYGNITWVNYQGTDDNSTVAVDTDKAKFFPVGSPQAFQMAFSPGEFLDVVNQPGQPVYALTIPDRDRNAWVKVEAYSYPLPIATRPRMLQRGRRA